MSRKEKKREEKAEEEEEKRELTSRKVSSFAARENKRSYHFLHRHIKSPLDFLLVFVDCQKRRRKGE